MKTKVYTVIVDYDVDEPRLEYILSELIRLGVRLGLTKIEVGPHVNIEKGSER